MNLLASASLYFEKEEILQQLSHSKTLLDSIADNAPDAVDNETLLESLANHRADFLTEFFDHDLLLTSTEALNDSLKILLGSLLNEELNIRCS